MVSADGQLGTVKSSRTKPHELSKGFRADLVVTSVPISSGMPSGGSDGELEPNEAVAPPHCFIAVAHIPMQLIPGVAVWEQGRGRGMVIIHHFSRLCTWARYSLCL